MNWTRSETSKLITLYHQQPLLYCPKHPHYSNRQSRFIAISGICSKINNIKPNITISDIKTKLKTLRSQYTKERAHMLRSLNDGSEKMYIPKLWCYEELQFIDLEYPPKFSCPDYPTSVNEFIYTSE